MPAFTGGLERLISRSYIKKYKRESGFKTQNLGKAVVAHALNPADRQKQVDLEEFEASLVDRMSSRTARAVAHRNPVSKN